MEIIAKIQTDFPTKFGIPRQSGLVESLKGVITFEPKYRNPQGVYGLDGYSYICCCGLLVRITEKAGRLP